MGRMFDHWHTLGGLVGRPDNWSHGPVSRGGHPVLQLDTLGMWGSPTTGQETLSFAWEAHSNGLGDPAQIEALREICAGMLHCAITEAVVEMKMKPREPGQPWGKSKAPQDSNCGLWCHWGVDMRLGGRLQWGTKMQNDDTNCGAELVTRVSTCQWGSWGWRRHRWQQKSAWLPRGPSGRFTLFEKK